MSKEWSLGNSCKGKFVAGEKVKMRGDMGDFKLTIITIHNDHFATCKGYGKLRHVNMNCLEKLEEKDGK